MDTNNTPDNSFNLEILYRDCFTPIFRYLYFRTNDYDLASDIAQSTFLKFMKQNNGAKSLNHSKNILFVIAKSLLIDNWRSNARHGTVSIDDILDPVDENINQEEEAIKREDIEYVQIALKDLNEVENEIISMRLTLDMDYKTIASNLNISEANARKIYSRALNKVGEALKNSGHF